MEKKKKRKEKETKRLKKGQESYELCSLSHHSSIRSPLLPCLATIVGNEVLEIEELRKKRAKFDQERKKEKNKK